MAPGYCAIYAVVVGGQTPHGRESGLAPFPQEHSFVFIGGNMQCGNVVVFDEGFHGLQLCLHFFLTAVQFAQKQRLGICGVSALGKCLGGDNRRLVHHFKPGRNDAAADNRGHCISGLLNAVECRH